jgi:lysophospholipase L1-like esterase
MTARDPATPVSPESPRSSARSAVVCVVIAAVLLLLLTGPGIRESGERMDPGPERIVVLAVGYPAGWVADRLPFAGLNERLVAWVSPDKDLSSEGDGDGAIAGGGGQGIGPEAFDPAELGARPRRPPPLDTLLVTGDSLAMPMDSELARRLAGPDRVRTVRDPHIGTGISKPQVVDWTKLSVQQAREDKPDAVVVFIGANEGFPLPAGDRQVQCCSPEWAAAYAERARRMMDVYRRRGAARVYWLTVPMPRDPARQRIARAVNAAIRVAAQPWRAQVRILDMSATFTPGGRFRTAMPVDAREQIVREPDGIHLNEVGSRIAADQVLAAVRRDFGQG